MDNVDDKYSIFLLNKEKYFYSLSLLLFSYFIDCFCRHISRKYTIKDLEENFSYVKDVILYLLFSLLLIKKYKEKSNNHAIFAATIIFFIFILLNINLNEY